MERHPEKIAATGVVRSNGSTTPFNAGDAVAAVVDMFGRPIPPSWKPRIGKDAKELLDAGFDPNVVCMAMLTSLKMARPHLVQSFAVEIQEASHGEFVTFTEYRAQLRRLNRDNNPTLSRIHNALEEAMKNDVRGG